MDDFRQGVLDGIGGICEALRAGGGVAGVAGGAGSVGPMGPPGPPGEDGAQGPPGADGVDGVDGMQGLTGPQGPPGADGEAGPQGIQGVPGNDGAPGADGEDGAQGLQGLQGIQGIQGVPGNTGPAGQMTATYSGNVTQLTNKTTGVTLNALYGQITTAGAALAAGTSVSFTLTNSQIVANDMVVIQYAGGTAGSAGQYTVQAVAGAGSAVITLRNNSAASRSDAVAIRFAILKGV
jgi:hypothetical protein